MNNAALSQACVAILALYRSYAAKGMCHDEAQELAVSDTCAQLGLDRAALESALTSLESEAA